MTARPRRVRILLDVRETAARFPVPAATAIGATVLTQAAWSVPIPEYVDLALRVAAAAFLASLVVDVATEARWRRRARTAAALGCAGLAGTVAAAPRAFGTWLPSLFGGLVLLVAAGAGRERRAALPFAMGLAVAAAGAATLLLVACGGLAAFLGSVEYLLGASAPGRVLERVWLAGAMLLAPLAFLHLVPAAGAVDALPGPATPLGRALRGVAWVLVPLVLAEALLLHAYAVQIAVIGVIPRNQLGSLVVAYGVVGWATWLVAAAVHDAGGLLRRFARWWPWATVVPLVLLVLAVWSRVAELGVTPQRYGLALLGTWMAGLLVAAASGNPPGWRAATGSAAALLLATSAGPWGAVAVSVRDQRGRLTALLRSHGVLVGGRLREPPPQPHALPPSVAVRGGSMVETIAAAGALDTLRPWFTGSTADPFLVPEPRVRAVVSALGLGPYLAGGDGIIVAFSTDAPIRLALTAGTLLGPFDVTDGAEDHAPGGSPDAAVARITPEGVAVRWRTREWAVPALDFLRVTLRHADGPGRPTPFVLDATGPAGSATMIVVRGYGILRDASARVSSAQIWMVVPPEPDAG